MKIHVVQSSILNRPVFISAETAAKQFAEEQTSHTGTPHTAEPVEVYDDLAKLNDLVDQTHRDKLWPTLSAGQRRALGVGGDPKPAKAATPSAPSAPSEKKP